MVIECFQRLLEIFFLEEKLMIIHSFMRIFGHSSEENSLCYINFLPQRLQCPITATNCGLSHDWNCAVTLICLSTCTIALSGHTTFVRCFSDIVVFFETPKLKLTYCTCLINYRGTCDENLIFHQNWTFHNCILR